MDSVTLRSAKSEESLSSQHSGAGKNQFVLYNNAHLNKEIISL